MSKQEGEVFHVNISRPVSDEDYWLLYRGQIANELDHPGTQKGREDLRAGVWGSFRHDGKRGPIWDLYLCRLRERFGEDVHLKAMNPDGTWRPWRIEELDR